MQVFLNQSGKKDAKQSAPLEYSFGRKTSLVGGAKELAHLYEVGGGKAFSDLVKIPIGADQFSNTVLVVVLDLSKLNGILSSLTFWLKAIRAQLGVLDKATEKSEVSADSLKGQNAALWEGHEDKKHLNPLPIPVIVVANKYDTFIKEDP